MTITRKTALLVAGFAIATGLFLGIGFPPGQPEFLPRCLTAPVVALETVTSAPEFERIWNSPGLNQEKVKGGLYADFLFMAGYGSVFVLWGFLIRQRRLRSPDAVIGPVIVALAVVAVAADIGENLHIFKLIAGERTQAVADLTRQFSYVKWTACGVVLFLAHRAFLPTRRGSLLYAFTAWAGVLATVVGGVLGVWGPWDNPKFELVVLFTSVAFLVQVPLFAAFWEKHMWSPISPRRSKFSSRSRKRRAKLNAGATPETRHRARHDRNPPRVRRNTRS